ncbi:MAG: nitrilase-related carbon-nitrogen hydrolase, partial [Planctomycetota bacterium]
MRFAAVQFDIAWEDKPANHRAIETLIDETALPAGTFVVLPELGDTGFSFDLDRIVDDLTLPWARELARRRSVWLQVGHAERGADGMGRNCATIIAPDGTD